MLHKKIFQVNKIKSLIVFLLFCLPLASATMMCEDTCYAGESYFINATEKFTKWELVGDDLNITKDDLTITQDDDYIITIILNPYMKTNSFEITFFAGEEEIDSDSNGGSSSGSSYSRGSSYSTVKNKETKDPTDTSTSDPAATTPIEQQPEEEGSSFWFWVIIFIVMIGVVGIVWVIYFRDGGEYQEPNAFLNTDERGYENNE